MSWIKAAFPNGLALFYQTPLDVTVHVLFQVLTLPLSPNCEPIDVGALETTDATTVPCCRPTTSLRPHCPSLA